MCLHVWVCRLVDLRCVPVQLLKLESKNADVAFGFRADTGVNVGKQGVRACFLGFGGEVVRAISPTRSSPEAAALMRSRENRCHDHPPQTVHMRMPLWARRRSSRKAVGSRASDSRSWESKPSSIGEARLGLGARAAPAAVATSCPLCPVLESETRKQD